jgi:DNA-binding transcriptional MerR regulator
MTEGAPERADASARGRAADTEAAVSDTTASRTGVEAMAVEDEPEDRADPPAEAGRGKVRKSPSAFRTISEVADDLHIPQHVLRFWETRFPQIKPLKRGGGRRYYRPDDVALLWRISDLLYTQGYTIKGVQRLLREGDGDVSDLPPPSGPQAHAEVQPSPRRESRPPPKEAQLPMFELPAAEPPPPAAPAALAARVSAAPAARVNVRPKADTEVERLRRLLADTLAELESLRALLP